ncbi:MAG: hypothetical protein O3C21_01845, partial [Verrucomicrobia bacterium]|nr:hypothetical protein [Verrucomicrobiota bacterium]
MNENEELELLDLEAELAALRPVAVDAGLLASVERELACSVLSIDSRRRNHSKRRVVQGFFSRYGQVAAAALLVLSSALLFLVSRNGGGQSSGLARSVVADPTSVVSGEGFQRVGETSTVSSPRDGGLIIKEGRPFQLLEYDVQEEQQWKNSTDGTDVKIRRPQKEQMPIPLRV